ncbi:hypothetical protein U3516DRAFT_758604 [Neocallimastix sp. 'constans']
MKLEKKVQFLWSSNPHSKQKLFMKYTEDKFEDGTFTIGNKFSYQVFITRTYVKDLNIFILLLFRYLKNKEQANYEMEFE